jgi:hypothetical protein
MKITKIMSTFIELCEQGDLLSAQQHLQRNPNINTFELCPFAFHSTCLKGHLHVVQWLLEVCPTLVISFNLWFNDGNVFPNACLKGHLHMAQWLLQVCPTINISANNEEAFLGACRFGSYTRRLEVAQWLLQVCPTINISANNDEAFRDACCPVVYLSGRVVYLSGRLELAQWLQSLKPYLYVIHYDENGKYKDHYIRTKEEANWERRKYLVWLASNHCPEENKTNLLYKLPSDVSRMLIGFI